MRAVTISIILLVSLLISACSSLTQPTMAGSIETKPASNPINAPTIPSGQSVPANQAESTNQPAAESSNCVSSEAMKLGAAIAEDYAFTSTDQVMGWFCNGAEFEDIMVALETADQTGASAEEMLQMLAAGMTWEEIWQVVGLSE